MTLEQVKQVKVLFEQVLDLSPSQEKAYLDNHCKDEVIRKEVEAMLARRKEAQKALEEEETLVTTMSADEELDIERYFNTFIGKKFNETYLVEEKLGQGGMGAVFRCTHLFLGTQVAIKVMSPNLKTTTNDVKRFQREARVGWNLSHPNIIKVLEFSQTSEGLLFMVMEFVKGETLNSYIKRAAPIPLSRSIEILKPLCHALDTAHRRNILHRDLKPANILISEQDDMEIVKLADFGIAKLLKSDGQLTEGTILTSTGTVIGSLNYMSPEQLMNYKLGPTSDIYSLGVILHEMLTGHLPIQGDSLQEVIKLKTTYNRLPPPSNQFPFLLPAFDEIFRKLLSPMPAGRYAKAGDLFKVLTAIQG